MPQAAGLQEWRVCVTRETAAMKVGGETQRKRVAAHGTVTLPVRVVEECTRNENGRRAVEEMLMGAGTEMKGNTSAEERCRMVSMSSGWYGTQAEQRYAASSE